MKKAYKKTELKIIKQNKKIEESKDKRMLNHTETTAWLYTYAAFPFLPSHINKERNFYNT